MPFVKDITMIDTVSGSTTVTPSLHQRIRRVSRGSIASSSKVFARIRAKYGSFKVEFDAESGQCYIHPISPMSLIKGHNVCGTNNCTALLVGLMALIHQHYRLPFTQHDSIYYHHQGFVLDRIDINGSFFLSSQEEVNQTLKLIREQLLIKGRGIVVHEQAQWLETIYVGKHSRIATDKFYNKYRQMCSLKRQWNPNYWGAAKEYAMNAVRFERVYRQDALKKIGLTNSNDWGPAAVREKLTNRLSELGLTSLTLAAELTEAQLKNQKLRPCYQRTYNVWMHNLDIKLLWDRPAFNRHREVLLQYGLDIAVPREYIKNAVSLAQRLQPAKLRYGYPKRFKAMNAIYL